MERHVVTQEDPSLDQEMALRAAMLLLRLWPDHSSLDTNLKHVLFQNARNYIEERRDMYNAGK